MPTKIPVTPRFRRRALAVAFAASLLVPGLLRAQTAAPANPSDAARALARYDLNKNGRLDPEELAAQRADQAKVGKSEEAVVLSPFVVNTDKDTSYGALNSNAISAINMELLKTPVAADIFTAEFMMDVGTTNVEDLLNGYGAGVGQVLATPDSDSNNNQPGDRFSVAQVGSRGLSAGATRRDGFSASSTRTSVNDTFDTERVEVIKGANALLFGASGAGGFANTGSKTARFGRDGRPLTAASATSRIDQFGSKRWELDANYGDKDIAFRFVVMSEEQAYRRLYIGAKTDAYYGTISARLPFGTTLRLTARKTDNDRIIPTRGDDLTFTSGTQRDPRSAFSLLYLLATNQEGANNPTTGLPYVGTATDPATGRPYQVGAIVNGKLNWDNASSWSGWTQAEDISTETYTLTADTVWAKWLATSFGAMYDHSVNQRGPDGGSLLPPRAFNTGNPFLNGEWANSSSFRMDRNAGKRHAYRANAVITNDLFGGRAKSQTIVGYDLNFDRGGNINYRYYEADGNFRVYDLSNPRPASAANTVAANQLGRYDIGTVYWPVSDGPIKKPGWRIGSRQITYNNRNYVLLQQNPQNPALATPLNPLGLIALVPGFTSVGGANQGNYSEYDKNYGLYGANYTKWFDDRFTTLAGYRMSKTYKRRANTSTSGTQGWTETEKDNSSFNLGLTYRVKPWLYSYYNVGQTFDPAKNGNDPYGEPNKDSEGFSQEVGFKYVPLNSRISGSANYYWASSKNEAFNYPSADRDIINPVGLNDAYNAATRGNWVSLDKKSRGIEIMLTAELTRNWRSRLGATWQNGTIETASTFPLLWNDEFYYNKTTGGVTFSDGTPFMVPTDTAGIAAVNSTSALRAPVVGATNTQLTVAMMGNPSSPYYSNGAGSSSLQVNGRIANNSTLFRALRWFQTPTGLQARTLRTGRPISEIPYAFTDPAGLKGVLIQSEAGEPTVGHPLYRFVWTNTYDFTEGRLRGFTVGGTVNWDIDKSTYWYTEPNGSGGNIRKLYGEVEVNPRVNTLLRYSRKVGRYVFRSQVNINNMFNNYKVELRPSRATGFTVENAIGATFVGEPRQFIWTNSVAF